VETSASACPESDVSAGRIVQHLERALVDIANDSGVAIRGPCDEREAAVEQNPRRHVEVDRDAAFEREGNGRHRHVGVAGEVVARVEVLVVVGWQERVRGHGAPERRPQRRVGRLREPRDDGAGVYDHASGEHRRLYVELLPSDADAGEFDQVKRRLHDLQRRELEPRRVVAAGSGRAEREEPRRAVPRRQAVREGAAVRPRRLRDERLRRAAEAEEAVEQVEHAFLDQAAAETEVVDNGSRLWAQRQCLRAVHPHRGVPVAVLDAVLAQGGAAGRVGAAVGVGVGVEVPARLGAARHGRVRGRRARVEHGVLLRVARGGVAGLALHPRQVAAGVDEQDLRHRRRAEAQRDDVLQRVHEGAQRRRDAHAQRDPAP